MRNVREYTATTTANIKLKRYMTHQVQLVDSFISASQDALSSLCRAVVHAAPQKQEQQWRDLLVDMNQSLLEWREELGEFSQEIDHVPPLVRPGLLKALRNGIVISAVAVGSRAKLVLEALATLKWRHDCAHCCLVENDVIGNGGDLDVAVSFAEDALVGTEVAIAALARLNFLIDRATSRGQAVHADLSSCMTLLLSALEELQAKIVDLPELFEPARTVISER